MDTTKLDKALEAALIFLGRSPDEARFRLKDILVEEVSFVDRAANRRRFLIVKQRGDGMNKKLVDGQSAAPGVPGDASADVRAAVKAALSIPGPVKEGLMRIVTEALERLVSVSNMIKGAEETSEETSKPLPAELGKEIESIADLLHGSLSRYPSPMAKDHNGALGDSEAHQQKEPVMNMTEVGKKDGPVSRTLREVGETAVSLAQAAADKDDLDGDVLAKVRQLAASLNKLAEKYPQPTAGSAPSEGEQSTETKATEPGDPGTPATEPTTDTTAATQSTTAEATTETGTPAQAEAAKSEDAPAAVAEVTMEEMDEKLSSVGSETADKLKVLGEAMVRIANVGDPAELVRLRDQIVGLEKSLSAKVAKGGADKLLKIVDLLRRAIGVIDAGDAPAETAPATGGTSVSAAAPAEDTQKRAAESQPLPPPDEDGGPGTVGKGPASDKPVREGNDALAGIAKAVSELSTKVEALAATPQSPASRTESARGEGRDQGTRRGGRGGPWVL